MSLYAQVGAVPLYCDALYDSTHPPRPEPGGRNPDSGEGPLRRRHGGVGKTRKPFRSRAAQLPDRCAGRVHPGKSTSWPLPAGSFQSRVRDAICDHRRVRSANPVARTITMALSAQAAKVDVVATTPLRGIDLPVNEVPSPVQTATQADIQNSSALDLADFMNRRLNGVFVNEMQDNPFQPDVNYRGFTASPLLGTPEGLSVYVDGVRQNQPFGDVVSWDLIERNTVSEMALMPGSNPVFGLNTLGGSISVTTKDGGQLSRLERTNSVWQQRAQSCGRRIRRRPGDGIQLVLVRQRIPRIGLARRFTFGRQTRILEARLADG